MQVRKTLSETFKSFMGTTFWATGNGGRA